MLRMFPSESLLLISSGPSGQTGFWIWRRCRKIFWFSDVVLWWLKGSLYLQRSVRQLLEVPFHPNNPRRHIEMISGGQSQKVSIPKVALRILLSIRRVFSRSDRWQVHRWKVVKALIILYVFLWLCASVTSVRRETSVRSRSSYDWTPEGLVFSSGEVW